MLGKYESFPLNVHFLETFSSNLSIKQLQLKLIEALKDLNRKPFRFEEISIPTIPNCEVIFEFGIAEEDGFNFLDEQETERALNALKKIQAASLDFFCAIRYYRISGQKKSALKFDYYMFKASFVAKKVEFQVFHKQGPRYVSPEELVTILIESMNKGSTKRALTKNESENGEF
ncbi:MAG: hypothetical protein ACFCUE_10720 [Candidatus Bathyarchaeia archaeon]|jgi:hypothetical protein